MKKLRILISSVGSMVGFNILQSLNHPPFNRRHLTHIIGLNSIPSAPNNFACDSCYLVPNTSDNEYPKRFKEIIKKEQPDLILCGRDEDTLALSKIFRSDESLNCIFPYGSHQSIDLAFDKIKTWKFAQKYNLPFAETLQISNSTDNSTIQSFVDRIGFPVIAKPVYGFSSNDVYFLRSIDELTFFKRSGRFILQEFLGDRSHLEGYFEKIAGPPMLFSHLPSVWVYSCQVIIRPDGEISPVFIARQDHKMGYTIKFRKLQNQELEKLVRRYAEAYVQEGGVGAFSIQFKADSDGKFKAIEINARHTGATFARTLSGRDEVGLIIKAYFPDFSFPVFENSDSGFDQHIYRIYHSEIVTDKDASELKQSNVWHNPA